MYDKICRSCGKRLSEFYSTGMLGCPFCYEEFKAEIINTLQNIQEDSFHVGKTPSLVGLNKQLLDNYKRLLEEKEKAGIEGDFSLMAKLSDEIFELKEELSRRGLL